MKCKRSLPRIGMYVFLLVASLVSVFPFYWMVVSATNYSVDVVKGAGFFGTALVANMKTILSTVKIGTAFWNSLRNSVVGTVACLFVCSMAGYGFQIYRSKSKDLVMNILLLSMMVPFASTLVPLFKMFSTARLLDTTLGFVLPSVSTAFFIFFFRQSSQSFPMETVQAARVDGLSEFGIFFKIYVPVMMPTFAAAGIVAFMNNWNNYLWPLIVMQSPSSQTMPLLLASMSSGYTTDYGALMLAVTICTLPTLVIFFTQQKRFISGVLGSVK